MKARDHQYYACRKDTLGRRMNNARLSAESGREIDRANQGPKPRQRDAVVENILRGNEHRLHPLLIVRKLVDNPGGTYRRHCTRAARFLLWQCGRAERASFLALLAHREGDDAKLAPCPMALSLASGAFARSRPQFLE